MGPKVRPIFHFFCRPKIWPRVKHQLPSTAQPTAGSSSPSLLPFLFLPTHPTAAQLHFFSTHARSMPCTRGSANSTTAGRPLHQLLPLRPITHQDHPYLSASKPCSPTPSRHHYSTLHLGFSTKGPKQKQKGGWLFWAKRKRKREMRKGMSKV